jgi:sodium/proline symporter
LIYTFLGGYKAVCWTDFFQGLMMLIALLAVPIVMYFGKSDPTLTAAFADGVSAFEANPFTASWQDIASGLAWGLGYFGMPHILVRFMAIRNEDELDLSRRIASVWVVISMTVAVCIGMIGNAVSKAGGIPMLEGSNSETVIVQISNLLSSFGALPAIVAGFILAGILAATMSTADSQLLAASSAFSENLLGDVFGIKLDAKKNMLVARLTVIVIAIVAVFLASDPNSSVFKIVSFAWAGFGATFGPAVLCALFWKRSNLQGIMAGLVTGGVMVFVWKFGIAKLGGMFAIYELLPAFLCALAAIVVVSLVTPAPDKSVLDLYEECNKK